MDRGAWWCVVHGVTRVRHDVVTKLPPSQTYMYLFLDLIVLKTALFIYFNWRIITCCSLQHCLHGSNVDAHQQMTG